jgi:hypothetical protein
LDGADPLAAADALRGAVHHLHANVTLGYCHGEQ